MCPGGGVLREEKEILEKGKKGRSHWAREIDMSNTNEASFWGSFPCCGWVVGGLCTVQEDPHKPESSGPGPGENVNKCQDHSKMSRQIKDDSKVDLGTKDT